MGKDKDDDLYMFNNNEKEQENTSPNNSVLYLDKENDIYV